MVLGKKKAPSCSEKGNVLFLILIAVALFAALSFAVTSYTRSGDGNVSREKAEISYSKLQNHITALRSATTRMILNGTPLELISYVNPGGTIPPLYDARYNIYSPQGGGVSWDDMRTIGFNPHVQFNNQIDGLGTTINNTSGNEFIYFLSNVSEDFCKFVNKKVMGSETIAYDGSWFSSFALIPLNMANAFSSYPFADQPATAAFRGVSEGCLLDQDDNFYYYITILER